jgi:hypothetical protein
MATDTIPITTNVPISIHPDALATFEKVLNIKNTIGLAAYAAGREALTAIYSTYSDIEEASLALQKAAPPAQRRQRPDGKTVYTDNVRFNGMAPHVPHGREADLAAAVERATMRTFEAVDRRTKEINGHADALRERVRVALEDPQRKTAEGLSLAAEARAHVKSLPLRERLSFAFAAVKSEDKRTVSAILAAQPYLSGLSTEDHGAVHNHAAAAFAAQEWEQLQAVEKLAQRVADASGQLMQKFAQIKRLGDTASGRANAKLKSLLEGAR